MLVTVCISVLYFTCFLHLCIVLCLYLVVTFHFAVLCILVSMYCIVFVSLHCIVLYCIVLHCIVLHCIVLHCITYYCIVSRVTVCPETGDLIAGTNYLRSTPPSPSTFLHCADVNFFLTENKNRKCSKDT